MLATRMLVVAMALSGAAAVSKISTKSIKEDTRASAVYRNEKWAMVDGWVDDAIATVSLRNDVNGTGWQYLDVRAQKGHANQQMAYAAGFAEGATTAGDIFLTYLNNDGPAMNAGLPAKLRTFLNDQRSFIDNLIKENPKKDYFHAHDMIFTQLQGLYDGYSSVAPADQALTYEDLYLLNIGSDLETLSPLYLDEAPNVDTNSDHCSALIRMLPDLSEVFFSQITWSSFNSMLRSFKRYDIPLESVEHPGTVFPGRVVTFSSYPGVLFSGDDFYQTSANLAVLETTIGNSNNELFEKYISPNTVLEFFRNILANRLADSGPSWSQTFSLYNSGTYNNEFLVFDYDRFTPGQPLEKDALWVLDQVPGYIKAADVTDKFTEMTYWPSYNSPYWPEIFNISGGWANVEKYGDWFTYDKTPRALIFKRNHTDVTDLDSMAALMRYNNFEHDPLSACDKCSPHKYSSENTIACRDDLNPADGTYPFSALGHRNHAATDAKITSKKMMESMSTYAISGPTYDQQPVFKFSTSSYASLPHFGMPDEWHFPWVNIEWEE